MASRDKKGARSFATSTPFSKQTATKVYSIPLIDSSILLSGQPIVTSNQQILIGVGVEISFHPSVHPCIPLHTSCLQLPSAPTGVLLCAQAIRIDTRARSQGRRRNAAAVGRTMPLIHLFAFPPLSISGKPIQVQQSFLFLLFDIV